MAWKSGTATNFRDLFRVVRNFVSGWPENNDPIYSGTGDGELLFFGAKTVSVFETWTLTCTTAGGDGFGIFSVSGSTTGALPAATVGVQYDEAELTFIIAGNIDGFGLGETFTIVVTANATSFTSSENWLFRSEILSTTLDGSRLNTFQVEGPGMDDLQTINIIWDTFVSSGLNTYAIEQRGAAGYDSNLSYNQQPGVDATSNFTYFKDGSMPYYLIMNKQHFKIAVQADATTRGMYAGYFFPYGSPGQYPMPRMVAGESNTSDFTYTTISERVRCMVDPSYRSSQYNEPGGALYYMSHYNEATSKIYTDTLVHPMGPINTYRFYENLRENQDSSYMTYACMIMQDIQPIGEFDGVAMIPGFGISPWDTVTDSISGNDWLVLQNVHRNSPNDFYGMELV